MFKAGLLLRCFLSAVVVVVVVVVVVIVVIVIVTVVVVVIVCALMCSSNQESIEWTHELIDSNNASGQLEFVVAGTDEDAFFPCTVQFASNYSYADFKFEAAVDAEKGALKVVSENASQVAEYIVS